MDMSAFLVKNSEGKHDTMLTFSWIAFLTVIFKVIFGGMEFTISGDIYKVIPIDATIIGALLVPTLGAYVSRRYTDRKFPDANNNGIDDDLEKK